MKTNTPQEPQSETPRTEDLKRPAGTFDINDLVVSAKFMEQQERELNEANFRVREMDRLHIEDKQKIQQELLQTRGGLDKYTTLFNELQQEHLSNLDKLAELRTFITPITEERDLFKIELDKCKETMLVANASVDLLAKQTHRLREALEFNLKSMRTVANLVAGNERHEPNINDRCILNSCHKLIEDGESVLKSSDLSSLTVLSRAEVESWTCECVYRRTDGQIITKTVADSERIEFIVDKCPKHILLERFTK